MYLCLSDTKQPTKCSELKHGYKFSKTVDCFLRCKARHNTEPS